jgi:hypothetical protein
MDFYHANQHKPDHFRMATTKLTLVCFLATLCTALTAQTFHISEPYATRTQLGYEILGKVGENYLLFRDKGDEFDVLAHNGGMVNTWTREIDIPTRNTKILSVLGAANDFSVIYKTRQKGSGDYLLSIRKFDPGALLIDSLTIHNYGPSYDDQPILEAVLSEDKQTIALINAADEDRLQITCFQIDKMLILWEKSWYKDKERSARLEPKFILSNDGTLFINIDENNRKAKLEQHQLRIIAISQSLDDLHLVPLQELLTCDVQYAIDHRNQQLVAAGVYSEKNPEKSQGHFLMRFDLRTKQHQVTYTPFDDQMTGVVAGKDALDASKGIPYLRARKLFLRADGGTVFVCERNHFVERGLTNARGGMFRDAPRSIVDYFYDDMILITTQPDGKVHWRAVLHKKQYSQDDDGIYSSFFAMIKPDQLRLFFNDEILHESTCSSYTINPAGLYSRESILNTEDKRLRLRFRDALQINANEMIVPSEVNSRLQLVRIVF